ncbi:luciferin sulfotransferase-like isoform X1 [Leguminivora glycinivorella]|uniref:luciferin sulfotransferase-like isoform X1 n=1 Tax=Leguminivora glycinivorella TaxID=1035111 RepID=UPI002010447D|nr:luciferin sulfotransferase-like isoform X1 [Leguminivora glycinivorella]
MSNTVTSQELESAHQEVMKDLYKDIKFLRFGEDGCFLPKVYKEDADNYRTMAVRPDDVWVATFPRSGTTMTQELVWLLMNDFDYDTASKIDLTSRYAFLETKRVGLLTIVYKSIDPELLEKVNKHRWSYDAVTNVPSPRFIKTHLPFSLLPENLLDGKVVYVARDPRDVAVSYYHMSRLVMANTGDFKSYWNLFVKDLVVYSPYFSHVKAAWAARHHPNMLFIFYEDIIKDLPAAIMRIADFLGKEVTDEQVARLCEHLDINKFRKNESVNRSDLSKINPAAETFIRNGGAGGWRQHFDEEMAAQAQRWMRDHLTGSDLRFPEHTS